MFEWFEFFSSWFIAVLPTFDFCFCFRIYSVNGKVAKNSPRVSLFQKNRRSPRIKASLSHTALESVRSGSAVKKIRSSASAKKLQLIQDENSEIRGKSQIVQMVSSSTSKLPRMRLSGSGSTPPPTPPPRGLKRDTSKGCLVAAAVGKRIVKQQLNGTQSKASPSLKACSRARLPPPLPPKSNHVRKLAGSRPRHKSWSHLQVLFSDNGPTLRSLINVQCTLINFLKKSSRYALNKDL